MKELQKITAELTDLGQRAKELRVLQKEVEERVKEFLKRNNTPGITFENLTVLLDSKPVCKRLGMKKQRARMVDTLGELRVPEPERVADRLMARETQPSDRIKVFVQSG